MDLYNTKEQLEKLLTKLRKSKEENIKVLLEFEKDLQLKGLGELRILKYIYSVIRLGKLYQKPFKKMTNKDAEDILLEIDAQSWKDWTKHSYKIIFRIFCNWLNKEFKKNLDLTWLKVNNKSKHKLPEELLTEEEFKKLLDACESVRDKALIYVLYESGCRIGEILSLQLKHITFDEYGAVLIVYGKTGSRRVRLVHSASYLTNYINSHPFKEDRESYLWLTKFSRRKEKNSKYSPLQHQAIMRLLKVLKEKTGLNKRIYAHLFRHTRATQLANHLTEAQMKEFFGWTQASDMDALHVHLSGRDVDNAILKANGKLPKEEEERGKELRLKNCSRCSFENSPESDFCSRCGLPLDLKTALEAKEKEKEFMKLVTPDIIEQLIEKKVQDILKNKSI
jgi:integrase